jgi:energy-coupling factor transporter ATP-binding protein EcfA2
MDNVWFRYGRRGPWVLQAVDLTLDPGEVAVILGAQRGGQVHAAATGGGCAAAGARRCRERPPDRGLGSRSGSRPTSRSPRGPTCGTWRRCGPRDTVDLERWAARFNFGERYLDVRLGRPVEGHRAEVGLIQALLAPPGLLVLDEPWEGLDAETRDQVPSIVREVVAAGGIGAVSDHRGETARLPGAHVWRVEGGSVHADRAGGAGVEHCVIELTVPAALALETVAQLRRAGHEMVRVRAS